MNDSYQQPSERDDYIEAPEMPDFDDIRPENMEQYTYDFKVWAQNMRDLGLLEHSKTYFFFNLNNYAQKR